VYTYDWSLGSRDHVSKEQPNKYACALTFVI
jgi:hypothetical protein